MQKIRFGLALDGQSGWLARDAVGESTVGPLGMLTALETQLGLLRKPMSQAERVVQFRECLSKARTGQRFYERSFATDELGTTATLLDWRDQWYEHGWVGQVPPDASPRLLDMTAVEVTAREKVTPGAGQRLADVATALGVRRPQIESVELLDPFDAFPLGWQRVLMQLPTTDRSALEPAAEPGTLLRDLQDALLATQAGGKLPQRAWREDGSVAVARGESRVAAAQWLARRLTAGDDAQAIVAPMAGSMLDAALAAADRPRLGLAQTSAFRPAQQLLPLAMRLLWAPLDFQALLQFLTLAIHPVPALARRRIAERLVDAPGIGGKGWSELMAGIAEDLGDRAPAALADIAFWVDHVRYAPTDLAPLSEVYARTERLAEFFRNRLLDEDEARRAAWHAGHAQASALRQSLRALMDQGLERIAPETLDKMLVQATARGTGNPLLHAQAGAQACVTDPAALIEPFDVVTWWQLGAPTPTRPSAWSRQELESLRGCGVDLPSMATVLSRQARGWLRPVLLARRRLALVLPCPGEEVHPVWLLVSGLLDGVPVERCEEVLHSEPVPPVTSPVAHQPLPSRRRWWQLPEGTSVAWPAAASYSSLEPLLFNPFQWMLAYPARLRPSALLTLPDDFRLLGNLAHRAVERLYRQSGSAAWAPAQVGAWFDAHLDSLVDEEGAVLRMPGKRAELEAFRLRFRESLIGLHNHLRSAGVVAIEPEKDLEAETSIGLIRGSSDLLVTLASGQQIVIDMKWSGLGKYRRKLQDHAHLQLAIYGHLQQKVAGTWPAVGYYVLREGEMLSPAPDLFPGVRHIPLPEGATAELWQRAVATWKWRKAQIDAGAIEVVLEDIGANEESTPPADAMAIEPLDPRYNPFVRLAGWAEA